MHCHGPVGTVEFVVIGRLMYCVLDYGDKSRGDYNLTSLQPKAINSLCIIIQVDQTSHTLY